MPDPIPLNPPPSAALSTVPLNPPPVIPAALMTIPADLPPFDPRKQVFTLNPEQIDFLARQVVYFAPALARYWPYITAVLVFMGSLGAGLGRYTAPTHDCNPNPGPVPKLPAPQPPPLPTVPAPEQLRPVKLVLYTTGPSSKAVAADAELTKLAAQYDIAIAVDATTYQGGSTFSIGSKVIVLPSGVLFTADNKMIDGAPATVVDLSKLIKAHAFR